MTTLVEYEATCAICGHVSGVAEVENIGGDGPSDLDLRFAEPARSNIPWWVQVCPACGYAADDISEAPKGADAVVMGEEFRDLWDTIDEIVPLARAFHIAAFIAAKLDDLCTAFRFTLYEAWALDDMGDEASAMSARLVAVGFLRRIHHRGDQAIEDEGADTLIEIDLLRRAGKFAQASLACQAALENRHDEITKEIAVFEINLCEQQDRGCHTMDEVFWYWGPQEYDA